MCACDVHKQTQSWQWALINGLPALIQLNMHSQLNVDFAPGLGLSFESDNLLGLDLDMLICEFGN